MYIQHTMYNMLYINVYLHPFQQMEVPHGNLKQQLGTL